MRGSPLHLAPLMPRDRTGRFLVPETVLTPSATHTRSSSWRLSPPGQKHLKSVERSGPALHHDLPSSTQLRSLPWCHVPPASSFCLVSSISFGSAVLDDDPSAALLPHHPVRHTSTHSGFTGNVLGPGKFPESADRGLWVAQGIPILLV